MHPQWISVLGDAQHEADEFGTVRMPRQATQFDQLGLRTGVLDTQSFV